MTNSDAFGVPIEENYARILLKFFEIECEVENNAPDFVSPETDEISLQIELSGSSKTIIPALDKLHKILFKGKAKKDGSSSFEIAENSIWFDIPLDQVKDIWVTDLNFKMISKTPKYITYFIQKLDHQFEWLQPDLKTGEIKTMSISKKKFSPKKSNGKDSYTSVEVLRCVDMISRAIKKIDLRINGAYVKFNTDKGRLEPLIISMGEKLGYKIEALTSEEIVSLEVSGQSVSHSIFLV